MERNTAHGFRIRTLAFGPMLVETIRSPRATPGSDFLVNRVTHLPTRKEVWNFKEHVSATFSGRAFLHEINGEAFILLATRKLLCAVLPIQDLADVRQVGGEFLGGRNLRELITLKDTLAKELNLTPFWKEREKIFKKVAYDTDQKDQPGVVSATESVVVGPTSTHTASPPLFRTLIISGVQKEVLVLPSMKEVESLHKRGVDNDTLVMCPKPGATGNERYLVLRLTETGIETVAVMVRQSVKK